MAEASFYSPLSYENLSVLFAGTKRTPPVIVVPVTK